MPYLVQLFAYECARQEAKERGLDIRFMLYPFDKDGSQGLADAMEIWQAILQKTGKKNVTKISLEKFCKLAISCSKKVGKPLKFVQGNGT